jgi:hypothetical protein
VKSNEITMNGKWLREELHRSPRVVEKDGKKEVVIDEVHRTFAAIRTNTRRKGESRRERVIRNARELAQEAGITEDEARARLRGGNPLGSTAK